MARSTVGRTRRQRSERGLEPLRLFTLELALGLSATFLASINVRLCKKKELRLHIENPGRPLGQPGLVSVDGQLKRYATELGEGAIGFSSM
jgi:hypothetical protein